MNRKEFIKATAVGAASLAVMPTSHLLGKKAAADKVRVIMMGVGARGLNHLELLLMRADVEVVAICDVDPITLTKAKEEVTKSGKKMPQVFTGDNYAWKKMLEIKDLDAVIIATPWEWHKPMIIGSLEAGIKYVGSEVVIGITVQDH